MGERVTVAYESAARERAARRKTKLRWHRSAGGGLTAKGERGEFCIVRQRPDRRHGIYRWGVTHAGHSVGSTDQLAQAKGLAAHHEFKQTCAEDAPVAAERRGGGNDSYRSQVVRNLRMMGRKDAEAYADRHAVDVERYEIAEVPPNVAAAILDAADTRFDDMRAGEEAAAKESPTRGEWEVIVTNPPHEHLGHILSMAGPGYGYREGNKIYLTGFYDDEEARHVANSISRKYGDKGAIVTYGAKRKMEAAEDSHPGAAERRRRPGTDRELEVEPPCEHGCPTGECKPFSKVTRDPVAFRACMARAREIGELKNAMDVYRLVAHDISTYDEEHLMVVCIDFRGQLRDWFVIALGQRHRVAADVEDIVAGAMLSKCDAFVVLHNHPSGNAEPSKADGNLTKMIRKSAEAACPNILFLDHLVVGLDQVYSFTEKKLIKVKRAA